MTERSFGACGAPTGICYFLHCTVTRCIFARGLLGLPQKIEMRPNSIAAVAAGARCCCRCSCSALLQKLSNTSSSNRSSSTSSSLQVPQVPTGQGCRELGAPTAAPGGSTAVSSKFSGRWGRIWVRCSTSTPYPSATAGRIFAAGAALAARSEPPRSLVRQLRTKEPGVPKKIGEWRLGAPSCQCRQLHASLNAGTAVPSSNHTAAAASSAPPASSGVFFESAVAQRQLLLPLLTALQQPLPPRHLLQLLQHLHALGRSAWLEFAATSASQNCFVVLPCRNKLQQQQQWKQQQQRQQQQQWLQQQEQRISDAHLHKGGSWGPGQSVHLATATGAAATTGTVVATGAAALSCPAQPYARFLQLFGVNPVAVSSLEAAIGTDEEQLVLLELLLLLPHAMSEPPVNPAGVSTLLHHNFDNPAPAAAAVGAAAAAEAGASEMPLPLRKVLLLLLAAFHPHRQHQQGGSFLVQQQQLNRAPAVAAAIKTAAEGLKEVPLPQPICPAVLQWTQDLIAVGCTCCCCRFCCCC